MTADERKHSIRSEVNAEIDDRKELYPEIIRILWEVIDDLVDECTNPSDEKG